MENSQLTAQYHVLSKRLDEALGVMQDIQQRDDNLYRVIFQADPISEVIRKAGYGGTNRYEELMEMANAELVVSTTKKMDLLRRQLYVQSRSFDDVVAMCKNHDVMLKCIPAIHMGYALILFMVLQSFTGGWIPQLIRERMCTQRATG